MTELTTPNLKIVFSKTADRWSHKILLRVGTTDVLLLTSVEGDAETAWPPSPPLQDLDVHELGNGTAVLAVGMAGTAHWSASFSAEANSDQAEGGSPEFVLADLACSFKKSLPESASLLAITYDVQPEVTVERSASGWVRLSLQPPVLPSGKNSLILEPLCSAEVNSRLNMDGNRISFSPTEICGLVGRPTRWGFRLLASVDF